LFYDGDLRSTANTAINQSVLLGFRVSDASDLNALTQSLTACQHSPLAVVNDADFRKEADGFDFLSIDPSDGA
jgi:hypothetical protein